jgi:hypothetical protein
MQENAPQDAERLGTPQEPPAILTDKDKEFIVGMRNEMRRIDRVAKRLAQEIGVAEEDGLRLVQLIFNDPDLMQRIEEE